MHETKWEIAMCAQFAQRTGCYCNTSFSDTFRYIINYLLLFIVIFSFRCHSRESWHAYWFNELSSPRPLLFFQHCSVELLLFYLRFIHFQTAKEQQWDYFAKFFREFRWNYYEFWDSRNMRYANVKMRLKFQLIRVRQKNGKTMRTQFNVNAHVP